MELRSVWLFVALSAWSWHAEAAAGVTQLEDSIIFGTLVEFLPKIPDDILALEFKLDRLEEVRAIRTELEQLRKRYYRDMGRHLNDELCGDFGRVSSANDHAALVELERRFAQKKLEAYREILSIAESELPEAHFAILSAWIRRSGSKVSYDDWNDWSPENDPDLQSSWASICKLAKAMEG